MGKKSFLDITIRSNFVTLGRLVLNTTTTKKGSTNVDV